MKPHESPRIRKKSIRGDLGDSWPVWNRGIKQERCQNGVRLRRIGGSLIVIFELKGGNFS